LKGEEQAKKEERLLWPSAEGSRCVFRVQRSAKRWEAGRRVYPVCISNSPSF